MPSLISSSAGVRLRWLASLLLVVMRCRCYVDGTSGAGPGSAKARRAEASDAKDRTRHPRRVGRRAAASVRAVDHRSARQGDRRPRRDPGAHVVACVGNDFHAGQRDQRRARCLRREARQVAGQDQPRRNRRHRRGIRRHEWLVVAADDRAHAQSRARSSTKRNSTPTSTAICTSPDGTRR